MTINNDLTGSAYEKQFTEEDPADDEGEAGTAAASAAAAAEKGQTTNPNDPEDEAGTAAAKTPAAGTDAAFDPEAEAAAAAAAKAPAAPAAAPAAADAPAGAPAPAAAPAAAPAVEDFTPAERELPKQAPADAEAQLTAARAERTAATKAFGEGELSEEAFNAALEKTDTTISTLTRQMAADDAVATMLQQQSVELFQSKTTASIEAMKAAGIAITEESYGEFMGFVSMYGDRAAARGMVDGRTLAASSWALKEAEKVMVKLHGTTGAAPAAPAAAPAAPTPPAKTQAQVDAERRQPTPPPTLATAPVAADSSVGGGEFAHLAGLEGMALERAIAGMDQATQDRYLGV